MIINWEALFTIFFAGVLTRIADLFADDGLKISKYLALAVGGLAGFLTAYCAIRYSALAPLAMAVIASAILAGKCDHFVHHFALFIVLITFSIWGIPKVNIFILSAILICGAADEWGNNWADKKGFTGFLFYFFKYRLTLESVTFVLSLITHEWLYFGGVLAFDLGFTYLFPDQVKTFLVQRSRIKVMAS